MALPGLQDPQGDPSDADYWESLVQAGKSPSMATAEVLRRRKQQPTDIAAIKPPAGRDIPLRQDLADLRRSQESTRVARPSQLASTLAGPNAVEGILDSGLNSLTAGLHQKGLGVTDAVIDMLSHGTSAHPIDTYNRSTGATKARVAAAGRQYPTAKTAAEAVGFFAPMAAALKGPAFLARGAAELPTAVSAVRDAGGVGAALKRIGQTAAMGGTSGAAITGIASDSPIEDRPREMLWGGAGGTLLGTAGGTAEEVLPPLMRFGKRLMRPAAEKGAEAARRQILARFQSRGMIPEDLFRAAGRAQETGSPALVAHLAGPATDDLSYLGASSASSAGDAFKESLHTAQRGEHDVLHRGVTAMSGREDVPRNRTAGFRRELEEGRSAAGATDYPLAYDEPPIQSQHILDAIRNDPDLSAALEEGMHVIRREDEVARIQHGTAPPERPNPLTQPTGGIAPNQRAYLQSLNYSPETIDAMLAHMGGKSPTDAPSLSIKLLDYMKRGIEPVIQRKMAREGLQPHDADLLRAKVQEILRSVDAERPTYQATRARQASYFGREEGARQGATAFDKTDEEIASQMSDLPRPGQQEAYRTTATSGLRDELDAKRYDADVGTSIFDTPEREGQLDQIYGPGARERLDPYLEQSGILNRVLRAATGGSQTEPRMAVRAAVKDASGADLAHTIASSRRNMLNVPGHLFDRHAQSVQRGVSETLAQDLNIPASDQSGIQRLIDRLYAAQRRLPPVPTSLFERGIEGSLSGRAASAGAAGTADSATEQEPLSDADYWESLVNSGASPQIATAKVRQRRAHGPVQ